jgi:ParB-like chromosome segregation protein Spo0J
MPRAARKPPSANRWRSRIVGEGTVAPRELVPNPHNWRTHPSVQRAALTGVLDEVGWVQRVIINQRTGRVVDGHLRVELALKHREPEVPVLFVDLDEREEALVLATLDPVTALAEADREALAALLEDVHTGDEALLQLIERLAIQTGVIEPDLPEELWDGMPEFHNEPGAVRTLQVHFQTEESVDEFAGLIGQAITDKTKYVWFPPKERERAIDTEWVGES